MVYVINQKYDKNNKKLYRGVEYRGLYLGFRLIEDDYKEIRRNMKGQRAGKRKKEETRVRVGLGQKWA